VDRLANLPLGIIDPTEYSQFAVPLAPGDCVLIYTDSLIEATSPAGEQLGESGLLRLATETGGRQPFAQSSPEMFCETLLSRLDAYRGGEPANDDVTMLLLQHNGANPAGQSVAQWTRTIGRMLGVIPV
jgi:sigma-B regulation protein RsbU (phosphoserine phosphatase)